MLHHLLSEGRKNTDVLLKLSSTLDTLTDKFFEHDWSLRELQEALYVSLKVEDLAFCIFLDGLDEQNADECNSVLDLIDALRKLPNVKLCVSSRAEIVFRRRFNTFPKIYMQNLTSMAMQSFVEDRIKHYVKNNTSFMLDTTDVRLDHFARHLVDKSNGVFHWTALVLKNLIRGIQNGDTWDTLQIRVEQYSSGLNELFYNMWNRRNGDVQFYKEEAARLLMETCQDSTSRTRARIAGHDFSFRDTIILDQTCLNRLREIITTRGRLTETDMECLRAAHEAWLFTRSAGLVEMDLGDIRPSISCIAPSRNFS